MNTEWGRPYTGKKLEYLKEFLADQGLRYDGGITDTVIISEEGSILATGSIDGNIIKCVAVNPSRRGENLLGQVMTELTAEFFRKGITHYFGFTKPENAELFGGAGLYKVAETKDVLLLENRKDGLEKYLNRIRKETDAAKADGMPGNGGSTGCIVAHANPFTLGHRFLAETAAAECEWVHIFILSESGSEIPAAERYRLAEEGVADIPNVILHEASDYLISPATFPTYFIKEQARTEEINCGLDVAIFGGIIAKALGITRRYVGTEPDDEVTAAYNEILKKDLPGYGIELREIGRLCVDGRTVSASAVRQAVAMGRPEDAEEMVPVTTYNYLKNR